MEAIKTFLENNPQLPGALLGGLAGFLLIMFILWRTGVLSIDGE